MREGQVNGLEMDKVLNQKSGLLGISGVSGDMRHILTAIKQGNQRAQLAFDIYIHRLQASIGAMVAVLGGIDALVFSAGVGRTRLKCALRLAATWSFLGSNSMRRGTRNLLSTPTLLPRIHLCGSW
jgi:acetate kinase